MSDWREDALCRQYDPDCFFPEDGSTEGRIADRWMWERAKKVCSDCTVKAECLSTAYELEDVHTRYGIWGGLGPTERHRLRRWLKGDVSLENLRRYFSTGNQKSA